MDATTLTIVSIVVSAVVGFIPVVWKQVEKFNDSRVRVFRVRSRKTRFAKDIIQLFHDKFSDEFEHGSGLSDDFIRQNLDQFLPGRRTAETENIFLFAVLGKEVVGFIFAPYYPSRRAAMVSYFGVKAGVGLDFNTAEKLVSKLKINLRSLGCKTLYFETQKRGLTKIFAKLSAEEGFGNRMRRFDFDYMAAPVSADGVPQPAKLFAVGIGEEIPDLVSKAKLLDTLRFLYYEVYGDVHEIEEHDDFTRHQKQLHDLIMHFEKTLPATIVTYPAEITGLISRNATDPVSIVAAKSRNRKRRKS